MKVAKSAVRGSGVNVDTRTYILLAASLAFACQTPAPKPTPAPEPEVVQPEVAEPEPEPEVAEPEPEPEVVEPQPEEVAEPDRAPSTYVAEPTVPDGLGFGEQALIRTAQRVRGGISFGPMLEGNSCGSAVGVQGFAGAYSTPYQIDDCKAVIAGAHALTHERIVAKLGVVDVSPVALLHNGDFVWTAIDTCEATALMENACPTDFTARRVTAMSFVGPELSYHVATRASAGGADPTTDSEAHVIDVRTKLPTRPYQLLDPDSLLNELKRNLTLRKAVNPTALDAATTLDEIWSLWGTASFAHFGAYYYAGWNGDAGVVDLRIWFLELRDDVNELQELRVWVRPKRQWRHAFEDAASDASGFFAF